MIRVGLLTCVAPFVLMGCANGTDPPYLPPNPSSTGSSSMAAPSAVGSSGSSSTAASISESSTTLADSTGGSTSTSQGDSSALGTATNASGDASNTSEVGTNDSTSNESTSDTTNDSSLVLTSPVLEGSATCTAEAPADCNVFSNENISYMDNANESPALEWTGVPDGTQSFAVTLRDSTYGQPLWAVWNIPADATGLPANLPKDSALLTTPTGAEQSNASFADGDGYFGPQAPCNVFTFELFALSIATFEPEFKEFAAEVDAQLNELGAVVLGRAKLAGRTKYNSTCE